jgi:hypothetical protein
LRGLFAVLFQNVAERGHGIIMPLALSLLGSLGFGFSLGISRGLGLLLALLGAPVEELFELCDRAFV